MEALVDDEDYIVLSQWKWHFAAGEYAARDTRRSIRSRGDYIYMHEAVVALAGWPCLATVDHKDGDGLNNQRYNLRPATNSRNLANRGPQRNNTPGYKGVSYDKNRDKWFAQIKVMRKHINLGRFKTKEDAARAYNEAALKHFGEFAYLNPL